MAILNVGVWVCGVAQNSKAPSQRTKEEPEGWAGGDADVSVVYITQTGTYTQQFA